MRSSTSSLPWEQKLVTQTLKTLFVNAFITWRMYEKRDLLQSLSSFRSLDSFRHSLNAVQSLADFSLDCTRELLAYADRIERDVVIHNDECSDDAVLSDTELERIRQLATRKRRSRLAFFNGEEGKRLRLSTRGHEQKQKRPPMFCALCRKRGSRASKYF